MTEMGKSHTTEAKTKNFFGFSVVGKEYYFFISYRILSPPSSELKGKSILEELYGIKGLNLKGLNAEWKII